MTTRIAMNQILAAGVAAALVLGVVGTSTNSFLQPAFAHGLTFKTVNVQGAGDRGVTIVLGHSAEPAYGAKPGIDDGKHAVEVFLEDSATALPLTGAQLKVDKYYFSDFKTFSKAKSLKDATETETGVAVGSVFGDPGHYLARQVVKDGIYGYRLYGTVNYFSVATLNVDSTVFCKSGNGDTTKFNSPGWVGSFGCPENIDDILFPENNSDVNLGKGTSKASMDMSPSNALEAAPVVSLADATAQPSSTTPVSDLGMQLLMFGLPVAAVMSGVLVVKLRNKKTQ